ncbi:serine hydrolase [Shewanella marisflavi]|uniref:Serine hydrolase n=1 Tax=Shewanella marisflavi TaxID=260364 RepID=A0ABX5WLH3_9GAMM|nr:MULTISPECIES: serine hydrolase domain-containing protein [Shewanella]QDF75329.1 serine hydrolase [Shewanella marisflavi]
MSPKPLLTSLVFASSLFFIQTSLAQSLSANTLSERFAKQFKQSLKQEKVPGGAFVIVQGTNIVKLGTYGKRQQGRNKKIDADTVFRLASVSKTFAGTLASQLVHEHQLSWQQPINQYLPEFSLAEPAQSKAITLGHIIGQSTGLMPNSYDNLVNANVALDKIIPKFSELSPICAPGICYSYQNVAFSFIEQAIERESGKSYESLLKNRLFTPLAMDTASIGYDAFTQTPNRAEPHIKTRYGFKQVQVKPNYYQLAPAAGVNASIKDIAKWLVANMGHKPEVISPRVLEDVTTPGVRTSKELRRRDWTPYLDDAHYGKGWRIYQFNGHKLIYHAGWVAGYVAEVAYSPELDLGMAMLLNGESRVISELGAKFWKEVFAQQKRDS